ncbi:MAG: hypothetical protein R3D29_03195 [Nitratireductor sp.]
MLAGSRAAKQLDDNIAKLVRLQRMAGIVGHRMSQRALPLSVSRI